MKAVGRRRASNGSQAQVPRTPARARPAPKRRSGSVRTTDRGRVVATLREIGARLRLAGDNPFRARAYEGGAEAVETLADAELERRLETGTLTEVAGIGGALAAVIAELATTGGSAVLERLRAALPAAVLELSQLSGVSKDRALALHQSLGVNNVDELAAAARAGRVREVRGFGPKREAAILRAIDRYRRQPQALRLIDARDTAAAVAAFVAAQPGVAAAEVAGGVRLWDEVIEEIVIVAVVPEVGPSTGDLVAGYPALARGEERGSDRVIGRLASGVRARVRFTSRAEYGRALVEETGPAAHLEALRE